MLNAELGCNHGIFGIGLMVICIFIFLHSTSGFMHYYNCTQFISKGILCNYTFENQFQIRLPEDFKTVYSYKNGSGYMSLIWPQEGFYRGYRLLSLKEIIKLKSLFQNKNCKMTEFPNVIGEKQLQQLDERIKPYLFCERWFPFAEYAGSLYLMLDYNPSEKGEIGQIICYVHDPDFIYYVAPNITEALKMTETVIENLI
mgnify:CR=1 FL=1